MDTNETMVFPEAWGWASKPLTQTEWGQVKARVEAELMGGAPRSKEVLMVTDLCDIAPFVKRAVNELLQEGKIRLASNSRLEMV